MPVIPRSINNNLNTGKIEEATTVTNILINIYFLIF
jgi:hypothetical protein